MADEFTDQPCVYCGTTVHAGRVETGRQYCMASECVARGSTFRDHYRLVLVPKQGFTYVRVTDQFLTTGGRSSGRTN